MRSNLLNEGSTGLSASLSRPLLCLFDRNFELSVVGPCSRHMHSQARAHAAMACDSIASHVALPVAAHHILVGSTRGGFGLEVSHRGSMPLSHLKHRCPASIQSRCEGALNPLCACEQAVQHTWTYKPLMQDVLGMSLNRVTLDPEPSASQNLLQPNASSKKTYEVCHAASAELRVWQNNSLKAYEGCEGVAVARESCSPAVWSIVGCWMPDGHLSAAEPQPSECL